MVIRELRTYAEEVLRRAVLGDCGNLAMLEGQEDYYQGAPGWLSTWSDS